MKQVERGVHKATGEGMGWYDMWYDMYDALFTDDSVTGNGSDSYAFNVAEAAESACGLVFDDEFIAETGAAGYGLELFAEGPETVDVVARCLALRLVSGAFEEMHDRACRRQW